MTDTQQQLFQLHSLIESLEGNLQATTGLFEEFSNGEVSPEIIKSFQSNKRQLESGIAEAKSRIKDVAAYSGRWRPRFRYDGDRHSGTMATDIPLESRPRFRSMVTGNLM